MSALPNNLPETSPASITAPLPIPPPAGVNIIIDQEVRFDVPDSPTISQVLDRAEDEQANSQSSV